MQLNALITVLLGASGVALAHGSDNHGKGWGKHASSSSPSASVTYSTNNSNATLPLRGGPDLVYAGNYGVPPIDASSPQPTPLQFNASQIALFAQQQIDGIITSSAFEGNCSKCIAGVTVAKFLALSHPEEIPALLQNTCKKYGFATDEKCEKQYASDELGPYIAQVLARMDVTTDDMQLFCAQQLGGYCPLPAPIAIDESQWFAKPKPSGAVEPQGSGKTIRVIHLSDSHYDPRYVVGSEGNCTDAGMCCRSDSFNAASPSSPLAPAARYGNFGCDTPGELMLSMFDHMQPYLANASFSIFTGDITSHDKAWQLSRAYQKYDEWMTLKTFKAQMGNVPMYPALGNHDSFPSDQNTPFWWGEGQGMTESEFQWEYDFYADLWKENEWIDEETAAEAKKHYAAFSTVTKQGLKIITLNTDFWYKNNYFNYVNTTNPDSSGMLRFLTDELQAAEDAGQRVWIVGHVPSGYDGSSPVLNAPNLFYSIVQRFSPHVIAATFFGHTHRDMFNVYYDAPATKNGTEFVAGSWNTSDPLMTAWIGKSLVPLGGLNGGWRYYDVDAKSFSIMDAHNFYGNVSEAVNDDAVPWTFLYSSRETYDPNGTWPTDAPLNATFWDRVTREMEADGTGALVEKYNFFETAGSVRTPKCVTEACRQQKICYMRKWSELSDVWRVLKACSIILKS
ncbi:hypothetical protein G7K_2280-t1 [Saitoella complicata NRRL Y-17804]|uniref:Sphingomyelin phosphodiesterase n=1 Tax=Saitoella complicata (strain BCRC 22490 / CBS 7301 / JCM 7358 / NBRC 10748 / NRRL Y-17804) TaxID=698492 RepID=A0A0E9NE60_SAICN|nr:hypothetical protein G7K_2280-t1 [Saitoella complicata NRRL Y-17804]